MNLKNQSKASFAALAFALAIGSSGAAVIGELGVLEDTANGGINPATGNPWAAGDTYRLIFITSDLRTADSTDIEDYNSFVQTVAVNAGYGSVTWSVVGSTASVSALNNTGTDPSVSAGVGIFNFNNIKIADNNSALWDGGIDNPVDYTEDNVLLPDFTNVATGTTPGGIQPADGRVLGGSGESPPKIQFGRSHFSDGRWTQSFNGDASGEYNFYALSEELTVIPEPSSVALLGLGGLALLRRRRK